MFSLLVICLSALGGVVAPTGSVEARIRASVSDDLRVIQGTFEADAHENLEWVNLLSQLPMPATDRARHRTFPGASEAGVLYLEGSGPVSRPRSFHVILPRRFGASGMVPGRGLFSNGLWHPHPVLNGRIATVQWDVELTLPPGATGVLNGVVSTGTIRWKGHGDRLSLAVLTDARIQEIAISPETTMTLVDTGPQRKLRDKRTIAIATRGLQHNVASSFVVVETPMRRRLVRNGPNTLFMSDRALRLSGRNWATHGASIRNGLQSASLTVVDPWLRDLAGSLLHSTVFQTRSTRERVRWRTWMPGVDSFLYDGRVPFVGETLDEGWPTDPLRDDPLELVDNPTPAHTAGVKLSGRYGGAPLHTWATALAAGATFEEAATVAHVPAEGFDEWRTHPTISDVGVQVQQSPNGWKISLTRDAETSMPAEPVAFAIDGDTKTWATNEGPDSLEITRERRPKRVRIDPHSQVLQENRANDTWPRPWTITFSGYLAEINLNRRRATATGYATIRRPHTNRWTHRLITYTNPIEIAGLYYSLGYGFGRKIDRRNRIWRAWGGPSVAWMDPALPDVHMGKQAIDLRAGIRVDTRDNWPYCETGFRVETTGSQGWVPRVDERSNTVGAKGILLQPLPGPLVLATEIKVGGTTSGIPNRQYSLGGGGGVQGLSFDRHLGQRSMFGSTELRLRPVQHASVPVAFGWLSTIQVSGALEAGWVDDQKATGWTAGVGGVVDLWGHSPRFAGLWIARAFQDGPWSDIKPGPSQYYLRLTQRF